MPPDMEHLSKCASVCMPALCHPKTRNGCNLYIFFFINLSNKFTFIQ